MASVRKRAGGSSTTSSRKSTGSPGSSVVSKSKKVSAKEQGGLRSLVQHRFLKDIFQYCTGKSCPWFEGSKVTQSNHTDFLCWLHPIV